MRAAVVGCGAIASRWIRALAADGRVVPVVLVDPDPEAAVLLVRKHGLHTPTSAGITEALAHHAVDVAINLSPPAAHAANSTVALEAGVHVLSEKPLATRLDDAVRLVALAAARGAVLCVMQNRGSDPRWLTFARQVRARDGGPLHVAAETVVDLPSPGFRATEQLVATVDLAIHAFDQVRHLITAPPVEVLAHETPLRFLAGHCAVTVIVVRFVDGSVFTYRGGYTVGPGPRSSAAGRWTVHGREVHASWDAETTTTTADQTALETLITPAAAPSYLTCITEMIDVLHGAAYPECQAAGNLASVVLLDAALASAATGRRVAISGRPGRSR